LASRGAAGPGAGGAALSPDATPAGTAALLSLRGISHAYGSGTLALSGLSLDVPTGEFLSLVGPSGCGKSTALRLIAGFQAPSEGAVAWQAPPQPGDIGLVFQEPTLMPWASVLANVRLPLDLARVPRRQGDGRARALLERVGLAGFEAAYPRELSGGMRMRVSLARALVTRPRVLLMDEPFAALDEITRFRLNDDLLALWRDQRFTVLFVTHSVFESVYLSTRVVVMTGRPGRVAADLAVALDQPRDAALRLSPAYAERCRAVSEALAGVMAS
jgi:NitT/TauT family transport system ATP-binding protein